jgi:hypothetical protein
MTLSGRRSKGRDEKIQTDPGWILQTLRRENAGSTKVPLIYINLTRWECRQSPVPGKFVRRFLSCAAIFLLLLQYSFCSLPV